MNVELTNLIDKYEKLGIAKGSSLLMRPEVALQFLDELEKIGIGLDLVELWQPIEVEGRQAFVEDPFGPFFAHLVGSSDYVSKSINEAREYIRHELPEKIAFVSFVLSTKEPYWENLHTRQATYQNV